MAVEVLLPKLGLTMETGLIEEWLVPPGTPVKPGDLLLRLATDKVDVEVEAEGTGLFHPAVGDRFDGSAIARDEIDTIMRAVLVEDRMITMEAEA